MKFSRLASSYGVSIPAVFVLLLVSRSAGAQVDAPRAAALSATDMDEANAVAQGWTLFSQGKIVDAAAVAEQTLSAYPRSLAALTLAVETESARAGASAGLDVYERWLGDRKIEDAYVLRRIALAFLREAARDRQDSAARLEALQALAAEGDADAMTTLRTDAAAGNRQDEDRLAQLGDPDAVKKLAAQLTAPGATTGQKMSVVSTLAASHSAAAVQPLLALLSDPHPDLQAAAASGLGQLGARDAIDPLRQLYNNKQQLFSVRFAAAGALYRLDDTTGIDLLNQTLASDTPAVRIGALEAMSSRPDAAWLQAVRDVMTTADQPEVRLRAARLLAPYDPDAARAAIEGLQQSDNLAVRELVSRSLAEQLATDFTTLRQLLRNGDSLARVRAAARMMTLTR